MRIREILKESIATINQYNDGGSLEGYVVNTNQPQLTNYLKGQGAPDQLINQLINEFTTIGIIRNMYIDDKMRGQGHGSDLMDNAIDDAFNEGAEAIVLVADIHEENSVNLVDWYKNYGFEVIGNTHNDPIMLLRPDQ